MYIFKKNGITVNLSKLQVIRRGIAILLGVIFLGGVFKPDYKIPTIIMKIKFLFPLTPPIIRKNHLYINIFVPFLVFVGAVYF